MDWLIDPFRYAFMQTALAGVVFVGLTCAVLGAYVVQRRMAFVGDAMSHTTLPGLVIAYLFGWNLSLGALAAAVLAAVGIGWISRRQTVNVASGQGQALDRNVRKTQPSASSSPGCSLWAFSS